MNEFLYITGPIPPSVNSYLNYRVQKNYHTGRLFVQAYKSSETIAFERKFLKIAQDEKARQNWEIPDPDKYVAVDIVFYFPKHGMDTNNHYKVPLDVLKTAGIYHDDSKVMEAARRVYIDKQNPRMELRIYETGFMGIFDSEDHWYQFMEDNCSLCKKNPNRCSTMTKALENKLTGDIEKSIYNGKILVYNKCNKMVLNKGKVK
jgi:Holliday junction resolvase RusA-like endonuclease